VAQFAVPSAAGSVTWSLLATDGSACTGGSCGSVDTTGRYTAPAVKGALASVLLTATSVADPRNAATVTIVFADPISPTNGEQALSGDVFASGTGMIADAPVDIWVQQARMGYSYWWANGPLRSDKLGLFVASRLPSSAHVAVYAGSVGYAQPCAVTAHIPADKAVRVELVPVGSLDALDPPLPQLAEEPFLGGAIFETTPAGRQPVVGAMVWLEEPMGIVYATTKSDRRSRYFICNHDDLPTLAYLTVTADGFRMRTIGPVNSSQSATLDIELQRN
jgi:hypothetical protein